MPRLKDISIIPEELLEQISCSWESNRCGYRKHELKCTELCTKSQDSDNCSIVEEMLGDFSDSEDITKKFELPSISLNPENQQTQHLGDSEETFENEEEIQSNEWFDNDDGIINLSINYFWKKK